IVVFLAEKNPTLHLILSDTDQFGTSSFSIGDVSDFFLSKHQNYLGCLFSKASDDYCHWGHAILSPPCLAKSKSKYILVRMKSAAETGYCFNIRRLRLQEKLVLLRYDPIAKQRVLFTEKRKIRSI
ncbi:large ribosomal subunit protein bL33m, partial [Phaenicophaeus curvirostris]